ncbi:MAG: HlyC/CorC family transporter [Verrucomicrobiota bacterium]|nr:HlyC/CorC family transporter [Verrucomicrobiota bacterium]
MGPEIVAIAIFAGASFFFALAETALFSLARWQVAHLAEAHPRRGKIVAQMLERPDDLLATLALGNTFAIAALLAVAIRMVLYGRWELSATIVALLVLTLIGGEVIPKMLAVRQPERWALRTGWLLLMFQNTTAPLHRAAGWLASLILKGLAVRAAAEPTLTDGEYQELLEMAFHQGTLDESEKEIILQIISLDRRTVRDVMRPRSAMACISDDLSVHEMIGAAKKFKHRRLPVYDETPDTIVGVLNTRALLLDPRADLSEVIEFPSFVPETMNLLRLFESLQKQGRGLAVAVDEFGGVAGLVTMEDIMGLIVGAIRPPAQPEGFVMEKLAPGRWRVSGAMRLEDFRREAPSLGDVPGVETMGGLLTHLRGVVPAPGDSALHRGLRLKARETDDRRVIELLVEKVK